VNRKELNEKFDAFVAAVRERIETDGQDSYAVLDPRPSMFRLRAVTVPGDPPKYWPGPSDLELKLQTSTTPERMADDFVKCWRAEIEIDEAI
jgi:hypothetical protein